VQPTAMEANATIVTRAVAALPPVARAAGLVIPGT